VALSEFPPWGRVLARPSFCALARWLPWQPRRFRAGGNRLGRVVGWLRQERSAVGHYLSVSHSAKGVDEHDAVLQACCARHGQSIDKRAFSPNSYFSCLSDEPPAKATCMTMKPICTTSK
jgi:hypothetical protein